ncbi:hypothetical protein AAVH_25112 [Aphelenchoides avenae]|nr:hypothetical protein AAVH_25112 [Aphelenchus avenae]
MSRLTKEGNIQDIVDKLFEPYSTLAFRGDKCYCGREAIADAFKPYLKSNLNINTKESFVAGEGEYVIQRGVLDVGNAKDAPFEKVYKRDENGNYVLIHDEIEINQA